MVPFFMWSFFYTTITVVQRLLSGEPVELGKRILLLLIGKASTPFYYIVVLMQLTVLAPLLIRSLRKGGIIAKLLWLVTPLYLLVLYTYNLLTGSQLPYCGTIFQAWLSFYYLGLWMRMKEDGMPERKQENRKKKQLAALVAVLLALLVSVGEAFLLLHWGAVPGFVISQIRFGSFIYTFIIIWYLCGRKRQIQVNSSIARLLVTIGDCSYGIFYIHCFILMLVTKLLRVLSMDNFWGSYYVLSWLLVSGISVVTVWCANRLLEGKTVEVRLLRWLGFR